MGDARLVPLRQEDRDPIAAREALGEEQVGEPVGERGDGGEVELLGLPRAVHFDERQLP